MENIIHLAKQMISQYQNWIMVLCLICILLLMIAVFHTARKNRKQIMQLTERIKELTKTTLHAGKFTVQESKTASSPDRKESQKRPVTKEDEEVFGNVIREIFP